MSNWRKNILLDHGRCYSANECYGLEDWFGILACRRTRQRGGLQLSFAQGSMQVDADELQLWNEYRLLLQADPLRELHRLLAVLVLELWESVSSLEEAGIGVVQVAERHLKRLGWAILEPWRFGVLEFLHLIGEVDAAIALLS